MGGPEFEPQQGQEIFLSFTRSVTALGPTQPRINWAVRYLTGVKRPRRGRSYGETGATSLVPLYASMACTKEAFTCIFYHRRCTIDRVVKTPFYPSLCRSEEKRKVRKKGCKKYSDIKAPKVHVKDYDRGSITRVTVELGCTRLGSYKFSGSKGRDLSLGARLVHKILHAQGILRSAVYSSISE